MIKYGDAFKRCCSLGGFKSTRPKYDLETNKKTNTPKVVKVGDEPYQEVIDSYLPDTDINLLIARFLKGDPTVAGIGAPDWEEGDDTINQMSLNELHETVSKSLDQLKGNPLFDEYMKMCDTNHIDIGNNPEEILSRFEAYTKAKADDLEKSLKQKAAEEVAKKAATAGGENNG